MKEILAKPIAPGKKTIDQRSNSVNSSSVQSHIEDGSPQSLDNKPMAYETPQDYASLARQERDRLIALGASPNSIILQSELRNHIPQREGESPTDFGKRYAETMNIMIGRGISILNDRCTTDVVASGFRTADGRFFDLGPGSGATRGEFREFSQWISKMSETGQVYEVPEKWLKFEKPDKARPVSS